MHPVLFQIGSLTVYTYGVLVAAGILAGLYVARWQAGILKPVIDPDWIMNAGIYAVLVALVGSRLWLVLGEGWRTPGVLSWATLQSGGDLYGGLMFGVLFLLFYSRRRKLPFLAVADAFAAAIALGHAIGRLGCFSSGDSWGKPTTMPWGVVFRNPLAAQLVGTPLNVRLHPTQLYGAAAEFFNFLLLIWLARRRKFTGELLAAWLVLYGFERGIIEFYRGDPGRGLMFGGAISFMQIVSLGLILTGSWLLLQHRSRLLAPVRSSNGI